MSAWTTASFASRGSPGRWRDEPRASKFAPGIYTQRQLFACLLIKEYLHLDYRTAEELIAAADELRAALGLHRAPDHRTLWWFARHRIRSEIIQVALEETISRAEPDGEASRQVALDWPVAGPQLPVLQLASEAEPRVSVDG